jgi:glycine betaine/proline transport system permease protein
MATIAAAPTGRRLVVSRRWVILGVLVAWAALWFVLKGRDTLALGQADLTATHRWLDDVRSSADANRNSNPLFLYFFNAIRLVIDEFVTFIQALISQPSFGRPVPAIGWLGVVAIVTWLAYAFGNARVAVLVAAGFVFFGLQGLWVESMDLLALTLAAVLLALLLGIPLGVLAGLNATIHRIVTPVLDFMQTMPTFVYLAPLTLFFLIGPASATIATLIYAIPPVIRITAHGIRNVAPTTLEATTSLGSTRRQTLLKVQMPMAKRTIVLGVNQTIMAALAMATIAALIDAPGLGKTVLKALETLNVGAAFNGGLAIVVMAIVLDRTMTAASVRVEAEHRGGGSPNPRRRRILLATTGAGVVFAIYLSRTYLWAAEFPDEARLGPARFSLDLGAPIMRGTSAATDWVQTSLVDVTTAVTKAVTFGLLNPLQALLTQSPWYLTAVVVLALSYVLAGGRAVVVSGICLTLLVLTGVWQDAMVTLSATLVATSIVMLLGVGFGVWMGRSARVDQVVRPALDAGQTMPAFVYLVPFLGLFGVTRFTAIVAAIVYASPVAIKLVADGIRGVSHTAVEAATAAGSNTWQVITKVQLPMARRALTLAANQGLIYVLAMVVVGGLVGAGGLGYDVVAGFAQLQLYGKGLAAGLAIVLLGIMLDRITQRAAARIEAPSASGGH